MTIHDDVDDADDDDDVFYSMWIGNYNIVGVEWTEIKGERELL